VIGAANPVRNRPSRTRASRSRNASPRGVRFPLVVVVASAALLVPTLATTSEAGALLDPFTVSPSSGPPGTVVHLSGSGCAPGIVASPSQDYVKITSTSLSLSSNIPVAANGSWSGTLTVPTNAPALPGLVVAACFTDGLPSLITTYSPHGFTVTSPSTPPGGTSPPTTNPVRTPPGIPIPSTVPPAPANPPTASTPTTNAPNAGGSGPGHTGGTGPDPGSPTGSAPPDGSGGARPGGISAGAKNPAAKNGGTTRPTATSLPRFAETASAAGLADPSLARSARGDDGNVLWILWMVLLALVAAASTLLWWWQRRAPGDAESTPDVTPPAPA
jgi:hypothetical protein